MTALGRTWLALSVAALWTAAAAKAQSTGADSGINGLLDVKRIYVAQLVGGAEAQVLRELIIAGIDGTKLFILTDNPERADAVLKGAADDKAFTESIDVDNNANTRQNSRYGSSGAFLKGSSLPGSSVGDNESLHTKERKHEAYATVRLCSKDGDVLWSTTQESAGAKFRGAGADVAAKIARQLTLDFDKARKLASSSAEIPGRQ
ncbi:MAG: hypothetical protein JO270_04485 [Acidobacteriaceae bacterium]|nr:hypothetical protein [Acidobacteriaceae bacterium]MBV8570074.1 hypothetical protein [Acidobacteriaceae bacterium]